MTDDQIYALLPASSAELAEQLGEAGDEDLDIGQNCFIGTNLSADLAFVLKLLMATSRLEYVFDRDSRRGLLPVADEPGNYPIPHQYPGAWMRHEDVPYWLAMLPLAIQSSWAGAREALSELVVAPVPANYETVMASHAGFLARAGVSYRVSGNVVHLSRGDFLG
jgi:hypothetical protein